MGEKKTYVGIIAEFIPLHFFALTTILQLNIEISSRHVIRDQNNFGFQVTQVSRNDTAVPVGLIL